MFLDWLLKSEEYNISYDELKMLAQDRSIKMVSVKMKTCHMGRILQQTAYNTCTLQEGWLSAMANGTCVSFCNQPKAKFGYLTRVTPVCRCLHPFCGWRHLATSRESKAHFGLPRYAPVTIAVNVTWMKKGFTACKTPRCMYPSIFNRF